MAELDQENNVEKESNQSEVGIDNLKVLENIEVKDKNIINKAEIKKSVKLASELMRGSGRILVRKSGTESKIRIMGESENKRLLVKCVNIILKKIR